jgi:hypothetical protein
MQSPELPSDCRRGQIYRTARRPGKIKTRLSHDRAYIFRNKTKNELSQPKKRLTAAQDNGQANCAKTFATRNINPINCFYIVSFCMKSSDLLRKQPSGGGLKKSPYRNLSF